jgi:hypothetical protein
MRRLITSNEIPLPNGQVVITDPMLLIVDGKLAVNYDNMQTTDCCCEGDCPSTHGFAPGEPCYDPIDEEGCPEQSSITYGWPTEAAVDAYMASRPGGPFPGEGIPSCDANPAECGCYYTICDPERDPSERWGFYTCDAE